MLKEVSLKYVFMGNINISKYLADYPYLYSAQHVKEAKVIFESVSKENKVPYEERNRINDNENNCYYYFTTTLSGIFYLVYVDKNYPEYLINEFFEELQKEGLNLTLDERGELDKTAKDKLRYIFEKYITEKKASSIAAAQAEIKNVRIEMKHNIHNIVNNLEDINSLDQKSKKIQDGSKIYYKDAKSLERETWWRNFKWTIIIILLIIGILLIIILPLVLKGSDNKNTNTQMTTRPNSTSRL